jgi:hypothetical protein
MLPKRWQAAVEQCTITLEPTFGVKAWASSRTCDDVHPNGPIPRRSRCCCMVCHQSGLDYLPAVYDDRHPEDGQTRPGWDAGTPTAYRPGRLRGGK